MNTLEEEREEERSLAALELKVGDKITSGDGDVNVSAAHFLLASGDNISATIEKVEEGGPS
jgi:hypothetical protein